MEKELNAFITPALDADEWDSFTLRATLLLQVPTEEDTEQYIHKCVFVLANCLKYLKYPM
jgi:hypothetical protein